MALAHSLAVIAGMPAKLNSTVAGLTEQQARWRSEPGEWSVKEVLCHLREAGVVYDGRMRNIVSQDTPFMPDWNQETAAAHYTDEDTKLILPDYVGVRLALVDFLRGQPPTVWERQGKHEVDGMLSLEQMVLRVANHEIDHLSQLRRMRALAVAATS